MKKWLWIGGLISILGMAAHAVTNGVWISSQTATADTTKNLCTNSRGFLHGVVVSSGVLNNVVTVYASSGTAVNPIATIDATARGSYYFDVAASTPTGLTYSQTQAGQTTILYQCY